MNATKTRLTVTAQIVLEHTGDYEVVRDKEIEKLEGDGWSVTIEDEEDDA